MKTIRQFLSSVLALLGAFSAFSPARAETAPAGHWEGAINLPGTKLEIRLDFAASSEAGGWSGTIDIPAQMLRGFKLAEISVQGGRIVFKLPGIPGEPLFEGTLAADGVHFTGDFQQGGQKFPFALERRASTARAGETPAQGIPGSGLAGHWQGAVRVGPTELRLVFHVTAGKASALSATLDSIDQGAKGIPVSAVTLTDKTVRIELAALQAQFEGRLSPDGAEIEGRWKQGPLDSPVVFRRLASAPEVARPQEPKKPYPYEEKTVSFPGGATGVTLAGTLTLPPGKGPFPAVVLVTGSGPQDRDETLLGHRPFLVLADHLTRHGIAVLRFDDRGVARSTGNYATATHEDFAADAQAAFKFVKTQPGVDAARVGLCGHSEGGLHISIVAAANQDVAFTVMLAGMGVPLEQLLLRQREAFLRVTGNAGAANPEGPAIFGKMYAAIRAHGPTAETQAEVRRLLQQLAAHYPPERREAMGFSESSIEQQIAMVLSPWFVKLLAYDPVPVLARVKCPVLALNGEKDIQVACEENLTAIRKGVAPGGNRAVTTKAFPDLNHLLQHCQTGAVSEYGAIEETMSPEVLALVRDWILRQEPNQSGRKGTTH